MTHLALFLAAFTTVFSLGFQQQNVVHGHYLAAFVTSFIIGGSQIVLWRFVPDASASQIVLWRFVPDASASQIAATLMGGPLGIVASMVAHRRFMRRPV
jgi:hypothetical protein